MCDMTHYHITYISRHAYGSYANTGAITCKIYYKSQAKNDLHADTPTQGDKTLQHTATHCNTLQHTATHCNTRRHTQTHADTPTQGAKTLQDTARHCKTLQHTAKHADTTTQRAKWLR